VSRDSSGVHVTGESNKNEALIELLKPYGIKENARTGTTAFARGTQQKASSNKTITIV
ncbi:acetolactate synthase small subunit, partial [Bacillus vallismortis]|nr:acetolactate synthase small subunit [Bacillus vallismortis]